MYRNEPSELADVSKRIEELEKTHDKKSLRNMPEYRKARALQRKLLPGSFKHVKEILKHKVEKKKAHAHPASKREHESDRDYVHGEEGEEDVGPCEDFEPEYGDWYDDYGSDGFDGEDYDEMVVVTSAHENTTGGATTSYNPTTAALHNSDTSNNMYFKYIQYKFDPTAIDLLTFFLCGVIVEIDSCSIYYI